MVRALDVCDDYRKAIRPERPPEPTTDDWCSLHLRAGGMEPRAHLDLCDPCYRYQVTHGRPPTQAEVEHYITYQGRWPKQRIDPKAHRK